MTTRTRYFVILSLLVTIVGFGSGLVAYYVGFPAGAFSGARGPEELQYVPRDAAVVAYVDVREVMASEVRQHIRRALPSQENGQQEFQNLTGINIETDIDHIVAYMEASSLTENHTSGLVLARGTFAESKIEALMREHGGHVEQYRGKRLIIASSETHPRTDQTAPDTSPISPKASDFALTFLKPGLAAVGNTHLVRSAVDLDNGGESLIANEDVMSHIRSLESGNAWAVGRFDTLRSAAKLPEGVNQLPAITWFSVAGRVADSVTGVIRAETRDDASANNLRDVVRGVMALAKLQAGSQPKLEPFIQSLELGGTGKTVALSFTVPAQIFELLAPGGARKGESQRAH